MENQSPPSPPPLHYATPGSDAHVLYTREGDRATVVIHRPERRAKAAIDSAADSVGQFIFVLIMTGAFIFWIKPIWLLLLIPAGLALFVLLYGITWLCLARLAKPIVIDLTPETLTVRNLDGRPRNLHLKCEGLYAIYMVPHLSFIWIRRQGKEMHCFFATPDAAEAERITGFLRDAAGLNPDSPGDSSLASTPPA